MILWHDLKKCAQRHAKILWKNSSLQQQKVILPTGQDTRLNTTTAANAVNKTDNNLAGRIGKFADLTSQNIPLESLTFLTDIGLVNHPIKVDIKVICTLETYLNKLFELNKQVVTKTASNAQIKWHGAPFNTMGVLD